MRRKPLMLVAMAGIVAAALLVGPAAEARETAPAGGFKLPKGATPVGSCPGLDGKPAPAAKRGVTQVCFVRTAPGVSTAPAGSRLAPASAVGTTSAPDWCTSVNGPWNTFRFDSCRQEHGEFVLYVRDPITDFPVWFGTINVIFTLHQKTSATDSRFNYEMEIRTGGATWGAAQKGVLIWGWYECRSWSCLLLDGNIPDPDRLRKSMTANGTFETGLNGLNDVRWAYTAVTFRAQPADSPLAEIDGLTFRPGTGCAATAPSPSRAASTTRSGRSSGWTRSAGRPSPATSAWPSSPACRTCCAGWPIRRTRTGTAGWPAAVTSCGPRTGPAVPAARDELRRVPAPLHLRGRLVRGPARRQAAHVRRLRPSPAPHHRPRLERLHGAGHSEQRRGRRAGQPLQTTGCWIGKSSPSS